MTYEATFGANGRHLQLIGQKEVRDDPGVDLWADTTTLRVRLHDAAAGAAVVGAGVLTLGVSEFVQLTSSMRVSNATSMGESAQVRRYVRSVLPWRSVGYVCAAVVAAVPVAPPRDLARAASTDCVNVCRGSGASQLTVAKGVASR